MAVGLDLVAGVIGVSLFPFDLNNVHGNNAID